MVLMHHSGLMEKFNVVLVIVLNVHDDNVGFMNWFIKQENHVKLAMAHPELVFYGEWLVPHSLVNVSGRRMA